MAQCSFSEMPEKRRRVEADLPKAFGANAEAAVPMLLREEFNIGDPVHNFITLPNVVKLFMDCPLFQRMRHIRQLGTTGFVYTGGNHKRFEHSIGTCYLAYELIKGIKERQPEIGTTHRDVLCVTLAALCHDLGHSCFSHMFEGFVHELGKKMLSRGPADGEDPVKHAERAKRYMKWSHEDASTKLLNEMLKMYEGPLREAGMTVDEEGDDFACIAELIDPPKAKLEAAAKDGELVNRWGDIIRGRPVRKAWIYEIVSNWRSGIDVDKFDYFRRDAYYLGIRREFGHERYLKSIKVLLDQHGVPTLSPPAKDKDTLRDNMLELRRTLHHMAYQHKTVKKVECHMRDILALLDEHVLMVGEGGRKLRPSEAAVEIDLVAYPKLTDTFVEALLLASDDPALQRVQHEYQERILKRKLMRLVAHWDVPCPGEAFSSRAGPLPVPDEADVIAGVLGDYDAAARQVQPDEPVRPVTKEEMRCSVASLHCGMGMHDPMTRVLFHGKNEDVTREHLELGDTTPLRVKVFVFWNPPLDQPSDAVTLNRLTAAFTTWAHRYVEAHEEHAKRGSLSQRSPLRMARGSAALAALIEASPRAAAGSPALQAKLSEPVTPRSLEQSPPPVRRGLRIQASLL